MERLKIDGAARGTAALQKGLGVLDALARSGGLLTFSALVRETGLPKGTLHRILAAFLEHGMIRFDGRDDCYRFGWRVTEFARHAHADLDLQVLAEPELIRLHAQTGECAMLALGHGTEVSCAKIVGDDGLSGMDFGEGARLPAYCTAAGKAMLAFMEPHVLSATLQRIVLHPRTPATLIDERVLSAQLDVTKARRYAVEDGEYNAGLRSVAAPILDGTNRAIGAVAIVGPAFRLTNARLHEIGADLLRSTQRITGHAAFAQTQPSRVNMSQDKSVTCAVPSTAFLGEGPVWSNGSLYWIDILGPALHRSNPVTGSDQILALPEIVGAFAETNGGKLVIGGRSGFAFLDPDTGEQMPIANPEEDKPNNRFNDGKCDRLGRFWAGTMDMDVAPGAGSLYRLDGDGSVHRMETGLGISNGIGWSPDDRDMYFTDSLARTIFIYDFDLGSGTIRNRRVFAQASEHMGVPDGLTVDAEGYVWSAQWDGWQLIRYAPDGRIDRTVSVPVPRPTSCTFGGPNLSTLYVTSARIRLTAQQLAEAPLSGSVFAIDAGVRGMPDEVFAAKKALLRN
jgi:sugar lactone lactonase YvrE/DNA-binding IclR family transcriptional regulator